MTLLLGYKLENEIIFASDSLTVTTDSNDNIIKKIENPTQKIKYVVKNAMVATGGSDMSDDIIELTRSTASGMNLTVNQYINMTKEYFKESLKIHEKWSSDRSYIFYMIGGFIKNEPFIYTFEKRNKFNRMIISSFVARGACQNFAENYIDKQLSLHPENKNNYQYICQLLAETIIKTSHKSELVDDRVFITRLVLKNGEVIPYKAMFDKKLNQVSIPENFI
ncbi:hypothetical protein [Lederbergia lenta]|uniref:hypothetical protein n=1 Tax=Lederbergia lenta TaxID=1467 RepID=UPI00203DF8EA|nr:hypothetical protein [Lederbergia lenta]MCM3109972.1 hypothetical protein [Lederbergia lenta]